MKTLAFSTVLLLTLSCVLADRSHAQTQSRGNGKNRNQDDECKPASVMAIGNVDSIVRHGYIPEAPAGTTHVCVPLYRKDVGKDLLWGGEVFSNGKFKFECKKKADYLYDFEGIACILPNGREIPVGESIQTASGVCSCTRADLLADPKHPRMAEMSLTLTPNSPPAKPAPQKPRPSTGKPNSTPRPNVSPIKPPSASKCSGASKLEVMNNTGSSCLLDINYQHFSDYTEEQCCEYCAKHLPTDACQFFTPEAAAQVYSARGCYVCDFGALQVLRNWKLEGAVLYYTKSA